MTPGGRIRRLCSVEEHHYYVFVAPGRALPRPIVYLVIPPTGHLFLQITLSIAFFKKTYSYSSVPLLLAFHRPYSHPSPFIETVFAKQRGNTRKGRNKQPFASLKTLTEADLAPRHRASGQNIDYGERLLTTLVVTFASYLAILF